MMDPHGKKLERTEDLPSLSEDDLEKRIGVQAPPPRRPPARVRPARVATARPERARYVGATRRRVLWRDSATILIGVVLALLAVRFLLPSGPSVAAGSPSPDDTSIIAAVSPTPTTLAATPIPTIGQIVNPSLHLRATPTPIPVITLPPATPTPKPTPTLAPGATPKPTLKPGTTPKPSATPKPTAPPAPVISAMNCSVASYTVTCSGSALYCSTTWPCIYTWSWGDGTTSTGKAPAPHTYPTLTATYTVKLTVKNVTGSDSQNYIAQITGP